MLLEQKPLNVWKGGMDPYEESSLMLMHRWCPAELILTTMSKSSLDVLKKYRKNLQVV